MPYAAVVARTVRAEETLQAAAHRMASRNVTCLLALEAGTPRGVVTERDLVLAVLCGGLEPSAPVSAVAWRPLVTVVRGERADEAFRLMELHGLREILVAEPAGSIVGLVTAEEALALLLQDLMEVTQAARGGSALPLGGVRLRAEDAEVDLPTIDGGASARALAALLKRTGADALGVCEGGRPAGIVNERDLLPIVADGQSADLCCARDLVSRPHAAVDPGASLEEVVELMASRELDRVAVLREGGGFGTVSQRELLVRLAFEFVKLLARGASPRRVPTARPRGARHEWVRLARSSPTTTTA